MRREKGFTLIELMIVIAIIAIIAAIAIPGLLQSQRASNERNASASLKTIATAQADFRANDRDGNRINDFWTLNIQGLFTMYPAGAASTNAAIKLIELSVAGADAHPGVAQGATPVLGGMALITTYTRFQPKAGYWYYALTNDNSQVPAVIYQQATVTGNPAQNNTSGFGFGAYPDSFSAGRQAFIINEGNTMFKRQTIQIARNAPGTFPPTGIIPLVGGFPAGSTLPQDWPSDARLNLDFSKMD